MTAMRQRSIINLFIMHSVFLNQKSIVVYAIVLIMKYYLSSSFILLKTHWSVQIF